MCVQNPVYLVFACLIGGRDLLYTIYDVPSISICRADQRTKALSRLGLPSSVYTEVTELQEGPARPHRPARRRVRRLQPPVEGSAGAAAMTARDTAAAAVTPPTTVAATVLEVAGSTPAGVDVRSPPEPHDVAGESLGECRGMEDIWADVADGCTGAPQLLDDLPLWLQCIARKTCVPFSAAAHTVTGADNGCAVNCCWWLRGCTRTRLTRISHMRRMPAGTRC